MTCDASISHAVGNTGLRPGDEFVLKVLKGKREHQANTHNSFFI